MPQGITNRQLFFIIFLTLTAYSTIFESKFIVNEAGRSSWVPIMTIAAIMAVLTYMHGKLKIMYLNLTLFEACRQYLNKFITYTFAAYFFLYGLWISIYLQLNMLPLVKANFLPQTPSLAIILATIILVAFVSNKGVTNIARLYEILGLVFLITAAGLCIVLIIEGDLYNILPVYQSSDLDKPFELFKRSIMTFGGLELLFVFPFTKINKKAPKQMFWTVIFVGLFIVLMTESTIFSLGINDTNLYRDSFLEAIKTVSIPVIERPDIFYLTFGLASLFAGIISVFTVAVEFALNIFPQLSRIKIIMILSIVFTVASEILLKIKGIWDSMNIFTPYLIIVSIIIIPLIVLILLARLEKKTV